MKSAAWIMIVLLLTPSLPAQTMRGHASLSGMSSIHRIFSPSFFAALPTSWVNSALTTGTGFCPTSGFDATKTMPGNYPATFAGLIQAKTDQIAANQNWLLQVTAGTNIHGSTYDSNNALLTWPVSATVTKCLVIQSSTHNTDGVILCSHGLPGFGGTRNPGCTNDIAKLWKFTIDSTPANGNIGMYFPPGNNYTIIEDAEFVVAAGAFQSANNVKVTIQADIEGNYAGIAYSYIHGWNPGDAGQPAGTCSAWNRSGTVTSTGTTTLTWASGDRFGPDFSDGTHSVGYPQATINVNGTNYTIIGHDPAVSDTSLTLNTTVPAGTWNFSLVNPATAYTPGCGDDSRGIQANCNQCFLEYNYFEKIHWWGSESHAISLGFSTGPYKIVHNWVEAGSAGYFSGGGPVDTRGGPANDGEIRGNFFGRDLAWRFLSAAAGKSPAPPFGCGPLDGNSAHDTCPFNWAIKNNLEMKLGHRLLIDGNIIDGDWADGQSGYPVLQTVRTCSGGATCGIYDPSTGLPVTAIDNVRFSNNWFRNSPQLIQISSRSLGAGNGGGVSQPIQDLDYINNLFTNIGDTAQFGAPGNDIFQWGGSGANTFLCTMSRVSNVAFAVCSPIKIANTAVGVAGVLDNGFDVSSVIRSGGVVTMKLGGLRHDPTNGGTVVVSGVAGWSGSFTIASTPQGSSTTACSLDNSGNSVPAAQATQPQPCIRSDGTFGDTITYSDNQSADGTLCSSTATCNATGIAVTLPTLAYKITDISVGDNVYAHDCTNAAYNVGSTSSTLATADSTNPAGLTVSYSNPGADDNTGVTCQIENNSGFPKNASFQNNTLLALRVMSANSGGTYKQHYSNWFVHNVFVMPSGNNAVLTCTSVGGQGTAVYACWDQPTFRLFDNVMQGRTSSQWSVVPADQPANAFPATVTCSGATADATCLGYSGYMSGASFPSSACTYDGSNPYNCPMMAAPWSSNFDLTKITPVATSAYSSEGVDLTSLQNAFTSTQYTCPAGASCGSGPYPD